MSIDKTAILAKLSQLTPQRRQALLRVLAKEGVDLTRHVVVPVSREEALPLSFAQQRLYFLWKLDGPSSLYNNAAAISMQGKVDVAALSDSLGAIVTRHEVLRTRVAEDDGVALQIVDDAAGWRMAVEKVSDESRLKSRLITELEHQFNLIGEPLFRATLFECDTKQFVLMLNLHHIISDGWSIGVFVRDLAALYDAISAGRRSPLEALPIQYADYAHWQREWMRGDVLEEQIHYWRERLAGLPVILELPTDRARPAQQSHRGAMERFALCGELASSLHSLGREHGATLFMTLLAAFQILLMRLSGQEDFAVGSPIANRSRGELEGLIGFFANMLVLRSELEGDPNFRELLRRTRESALGAYAHQDIPFEYLVEQLKPERSLSYTPLFQVVMVLQNTPLAALSLSGVAITPMELEQRTAKFDLTLQFQEAAGGLQGSMEYNTDLFDRRTIERWIGYYRLLLEQITADPDRRISSYELLSKEERRQILREWNETESRYAEDKLIHELFAEQAEKSPEAIAVVYEDSHLTYERLNDRSNQLGRYLREQSVGPEVRVGICMERSVELLIGILGILKAGGAYVPMDPAYPKERMEYVIADAGIRCVLTEERLIQRLSFLSAAAVRCVSMDRLDYGCCDASPVDKRIHSALQSAYVIYTSGSTGRPKGVTNHHHGLLNRLLWMQRKYQLNLGERVLQKTPLSFDVSVWELLWPILHGSAVVFAKPDGHKDPFYLQRELQRQAISIVHFVPSMLQAYLEISTESPAFLREVICSGEALGLSVQQRFFEKIEARLHNLYGPTEASIDVSFWQCDSQIMRVPIGRPIDNTELYILDRYLDPAPIGVTGELYIGGAGLARGYLNRSGMTAERFVPHPFDAGAGERLYRTGDACRYLVDGNIEFIGRIDNQVKIRGYRIELGEIESRLNEHAQIAHSVVIAREDEEKNKQLVAYYTLRSAGALVEAGNLRDYLHSHLPEYMVPSAYVQMDLMPLTSNGKVDRKSLPSPREGAYRRSEYEEPRNAVEAQLCAIWSEVLDVKRIGIHDNFFEVGGDSILSIEILTKAMRHGLLFSLRDLFQHPSVAQLAYAIGASAVRKEFVRQTAPFELLSDVEAIELRDNNIEDGYPLSALQNGMVFHSELERSAVYHDIFSYHLGHRFDETAFRAALAQVVARHSILRTGFALYRSERALQIVYRTIELPLQITDLTSLTEAAQEEAIASTFEAEKIRHFDFACAPLFRVLIHIRDVDSFQYTLSFHHAILDGWSVASLQTELFNTYDQILIGRSKVPSALRSTYRDFIAAEQLAISSSESSEHWRRYLKGAIAPELPQRWSSPATIQAGNTYELDLTEITAALKRLSVELAVPLKSVLLAGHLKVVSMLGGQEDVMTGLVFNGRAEQAEGEQVLGLFLNTLPLRINVGDNSWREQIIAAFQNEQALLPHRRYPLSEIQRLLDGQKLADTYFSFTHFHIYRDLRRDGEKDLNIRSSYWFEQTNFPLAAIFSCSFAEDAVALTLAYDRDRFSNEQVQYIAGYYKNAYRSMLSDANSATGGKSLLSVQEHHRLLTEWNNTQRRYPKDKLLHELIEEQVRSTPDAIAVAYEEQQLTYEQLDSRSNRLAHFLKALGVGLEVRVGICMERSVEMMVAIVGCLKAGGAYVPIDPAYPAERIAFIFDDAAIAVLLTQSKLAETLPTHWSRVVSLDKPLPEIHSESVGSPENFGDAHNLVYVIYTSGSTGTPKGVAVTQSGVMNYLSYASERYGIACGRGAPVNTSISFDATVTSVLAPLIAGRTVELLVAGAGELEALAIRLSQACNYSLVKLTPAHLEILEHLHPSAIRDGAAHHLVIGGDALTARHVARWRSNASEVKLINEYGPTETVVGCATYEVEVGAEYRGPIPIGRPISNTELYVLDRKLQPVPIGTQGELYIGGAGLARGYLNKAGLTAERFVPHPFSKQSGERLYRTGDGCRYIADGNIEYIGRLDNQVKVRGFRIELGEIEARLSEHPLIAQCVVTTSQDEQKNRRLVAYYTLKQVTGSDVSNRSLHTDELTAAELREYLAARLPEYMVPSAYVSLTSLPLTVNGKVDRKALPPPDDESYGRGEYEAPQGEIELKLARIWGQLLNVERVGRHDNFFELGGDSIMAMRVMAQVRESLGIEPSLRAIFDAQTLASLSRQLSDQYKQSCVPLLRAESRGAPVELSYSQERLWILEQMGLGGRAYHIPIALRIVGAVDEGALQKSFAGLIERHESLRTRFESRDGLAVQVIEEACEFSLGKEDLSALQSMERARELERLIEEEAQRPFDITRGPLLRVKLVKLSARERALLLTLHHLITDGWSMGVMVRELVELYASHIEGRVANLPELSVQYADYAQWQRKWLRSEVLETQLEYWKEHLADAPQELRLPTDRIRPAIATHRGAVQLLSISKEQIAQLHTLAKSEGATLFMVLLGIFQVLLSRLSGQDDIVIGTPIAGRTHQATEALIGFFVNTLALRLRVHERESFKEHVRRVKEATLGAYANQDLPFERLVQELKPVRDLSRQPIFQVMLILQNVPVEELSVGGLSWQGLEQAVTTTKFDLELSLQETAEGLVGSLVCSTDLFDETSIERIARQYLRLAEQIAHDSSRPLIDYALLSNEERHRIVVEWNTTHAANPNERRVHELFAEQVQRTPDAIAVVYQEQQLTYWQLGRRVNQLANVLRAQGVGPEVRVGLCVERSVEMLIGIVGTLKAGGAYVPLDPSYPNERLEYVLQDADINLLLTSTNLLRRLDFLSSPSLKLHSLDCHVGEFVDDDCEPVEAEPASALQSAYVIYTSGSTGKPKGAINHHRGLTNRIGWMQAEYRLAPGERVLQKTPYSFDVSVWELLWPIMSGGSVVFAKPEGHKDPHYLHRELQQQAVSIVHFVPSMLQFYLQAGGAAPSSLRAVICSGEELSSSLQQAFFARCKDTQLHNLFGPTEASIDVGYWRCDVESTSVPIGRPIWNTELYILDRALIPVPIGVTGELYIGGVGLGRGYLNRAGLTGERFVPHPFSERDGERLYRSGDACRYLADGNIEFIGRMDNQVKVRGFRIELGEIESCLNGHPRVGQSVVIVREEDENTRLIAYYSQKNSESVIASELREYVQSRLPEYMVPSAYVVLAVLPLTPNGKTDRKALPTPEGEAYVRRVYEAPQGEIEERLASIWQALLKVDRIGRHDNFFELGGHSLLIVQLLERLQRTGMRADVRRVFSSPSLKLLAEALQEQIGADREVPANRIPLQCERITPDLLPLIELKQEEIDRIVQRVPGGATNIQDIYPLAPLQEGMLFHYLMNERGDAYLFQSSLAFDSRERLDCFLSALQDVIERHDILRTAVLWEGLSRAVQVVWRAAPLVVEQMEPREIAGVEELRERFDPRHYRLDVRNAPMARAMFARERDSDRWWMVLLSHHLVLDHTTLEIILEEVQTHLRGEKTELPTPVPFRNFVAQACFAEGEARHQEFFTRMLSAVDAPTLPFGLENVQGEGAGISEAHRQVDTQLTRSLRASARRLGVSVASLCHLAWALVLARASNRKRVVFGTVLFGRMNGSEGADRALGMFINTLPICIDVGDLSVEASVRKTHGLLAELLRHEHASLADAQRCSAIPIGTPLFSALLNYRHSKAVLAVKSERAWTGVELVSSDERTNYPLTLSVEDDGEALGLTTQAGVIAPERVNDLMHVALTRLVEALQYQPQQSTKDVDILPAAERRQLLIEWNATQRPYPQDRLLHQLFEEQAHRQPDAIAVACDEDQLTYGELDRLSNQLARYLEEFGVSLEARVGLCLERSSELLVGILGILKAGGAYVPIDPAFPKERIEYVIADAGIELVLTEAELMQLFTFVNPDAVKCVLMDRKEYRSHSDRSLDHSTHSSLQSAYVIYTSGSTGKPKGVAVAHRNTVQLVMDQSCVLITREDRMVYCASPTFDASTWEVWGSLLNGACTLLVSQSVLLDPAQLCACLRNQSASILQLTAGMLGPIADELAPVFSNLKYLLFGGDRADAQVLAKIVACSAPEHLVHTYGPTETVAFAVTYEVAKSQDTLALPIGRPISNTALYILDSELSPTPIGVSGELYIGGAGLARGYLNRPGLTSERFVPHPFGARGGERLYRTGDACRYLSDGNIEFIGRIDNQVKIRGFRIELGEIESCLNEHARIERSVVIAKEDEEKNKRLIAYYVEKKSGEGSARLTSGELRSHVQSRLPEYMVPSAYVYMDALPLTLNGKIDRKGLPLPDGESYSRGGYEAPQGEIEEKLAEIWQALLKVERVGRHDNFFELGGDSISAMRMVTHVREALLLELSIRVLFETQTLALVNARLSDQVDRGTPFGALPALTPQLRSQRVMLSYAQERLWFLERMGLSGTAYHIPIGMQIDGELDVAALSWSMKRLIERHESLRTRFVNEGGRGIQVIESENGFRLAKEDLSELPEEARAEALRRRVQEESQQRFNLESGPLMRVKLIKVGEQESVLLMTLHHLITDGWSMGVMVRELAELYRSRKEGRAVQLPALTIQYADYALWQRGWLQGEVLDKQLEYWEAHLRGAPEEIGLPSDRDRPAISSFRAGKETLRIGKEEVEKLRRLEKSEAATLYMVLLGAFQVLLSRISGQSDVVIGAPIAGRTHQATEGLIGFFVNTLALRQHVNARTSFVDHLRGVRETTLNAYAHQDLPFERLVQVLKPVRDLSRQPIFQVVFVLQNAPEEELIVSGLKWQSLSQEFAAAKFDLEFELQETPEGLAGNFVYATDLFERSSIERMARLYERLVEQIAEDATRPLSSYDLLSRSEKHRLLVEWNETYQEYPRDKLIHELFEEQAQQTPDAMAVVYEDEQLSYGELDRRSNQLAHYLREQGVGPEVCVGICMERSVELLIGMLGILKAGGAYVPIDPSYPEERLQFMLEDVAPRVVLIQEKLRDRLPERFIEVMALDSEWSIVSAGVVDDCAATGMGLTSDHLAYVIYTSGSTGRPKGASIDHRGLANLVHWYGQEFCFSAEDRVLIVSSFSFDLTQKNFFACLLGGGVVQLAAEPFNPQRIAKAICEHCVTLLNMAPSAFYSLVNETASSDLSSVRHVFLGGEPIQLSQLSSLGRNCPQLQVVNSYGPTECTDVSSFHRLRANYAEEPAGITPIGRPIGNAQLYLLDSELNPVPMGVKGELYIGGVGVSRGYLNRPGFTAERFIPHPFDAQGGKRLYRTGDACRYLSDGNIEFIGRIDSQVKIRGFRIELGEIESRINEHPQVEQSVVIAKEDEQSNKRLIAYYTEKQPEGEGAARLTSMELRAYVQHRLPEYMVPSAYVYLNALPLTVNGKVDRKGLPVPEGDAYSRAVYQAPEGEREELVAAIWQELLKVECVGRNDNFFELGGHSLLIIRVIERLKIAGLHGEVRGIFSASTLREVAEELEQTSFRVLDVPANKIQSVEQGDAEGQFEFEGRICEITPDLLPLVELQQAEIDRIVEYVPGGAQNIQDIYPLVPLQEGILFHHLMNKRGDVYVTSTLLAFDHRELVDRFLMALQSVIDRHDILRTGVMWEGLREPVQVVWRQVPLPIEELEGSEGVTTEQLRERFDSRHYRIDVRDAPLVRAIVSREKSGAEERGRWLLLLLNHHLVSDHTTLEIIIAEVQAHLLGSEKQLPSPLPFRNFVAQARLGVKAAEHEAFFKEMLEKVTEPTLPFGLQDVQGDGSEIREVREDVEKNLVHRLRMQARTLKVSVASLCHVAFAQVLARVSSQARVVFGTILFGRMGGSEGADRVLGMFINTLPICIEIDGRNVRESVQQTHRLLAELMRHEHASLALAQRCSGVATGTPLFSALLNYRHNQRVVGEGAAAWEGMEVLHSEERTNYPVVLSVEDYGEALSLTAKTSGIEPERISELMYRALEQLAAALEMRPQLPLRQVDVLTHAERHRLLIDWNDTKQVYPSDKLIHHLFEEQAAKRPDAMAVVYEDEQLSYGELDRRSNQLAHYLIEQGVGPEVRVGICMERSVELLIAIVGILKAGGAYVPIDPSYLEERMAYLLEDAALAVLLTHSKFALRLPVHDGRNVELDAQWIEIDAYRCNAPINNSNPENLAYVIYTSGSTGRPRGVGVRHRSVVNLWRALDQAIYTRYPEVSRIGLNASLAFDASVKQWVGLLSGRTLEIVPQAIRVDPEIFLRYASTHCIEVLDCTPSQLGAVLIAGELGQKYRPTSLLIGGEAIDPALWQILSTQQNNGQNSNDCFNVYGPTECCVDSTIALIDNTNGTPHIGRPISNTALYILDSELSPTPIGVSGELYIGGAGLARGYLNRPGLTSERFVPHPFGARGGERLYRTGDACRYLSDGNIEFIGRIDNQVKIRGFRIELGEIESCLNEHARIERSVVIAKEDEEKNKRLIAYYVEKKSGEGSARLTSGELRSHVQSRLPEYMVPSAYVYMDALPLTTNGKVDRKGLPDPDGESYSRGEYEAPQGEIEASIAAIWQALLKVEQVGRNDNFFELGGHSLLIVQLIERLQREGIEADVRSVFISSTLRSLAQALSTGAQSKFAVPANRLLSQSERITPDLLPLIELQQAEIDRIVERVSGGTQNIQDIYPLAPLQEGILFHHLMNERGDAYLRSSLLAFDSRKRLDLFLVALQSVIDRHDILRTGVMWEGLREPVQVVLRQVPLPIEELEGSEGVTTEQLRERFDSRHYRIDVRDAPLVRAIVSREKSGTEERGRWLLMLLNHHLVSDHTTSEIIVDEVQVHLLGKDATLPQPLPFRNFVAQARLGRQAGEDETFFKEMLEKVTEPTLPFGLQDVQGDGSEIREVREDVEKNLVHRLRMQARTLKVSVASLCHVAFAQVLARVSSQARVVFGTILFGRMGGSEGADRVLGMFINTLPICIEIDGRNVRESVQQTHRLLAELMRHEHASLALAQRCSGVATGTPLFSALLNYRHNQRVVGEGAAAWEGMEVLHSEERTNYPLTLSVEDDGEGLGFTTQASGVEPERVNELMHTALLQLTEALEHTPGIALQDLDVLPAAEKHRLLVEWNETHQEYPRDKLIHELFEEQAQQTPDAMAVVYEDEQLSYGELDRRSNQLAHYLREQGVGPEVCVGICMERSVELLIGMLGILKAGGAYVPIDPSYPEERLQFMLEDVAPRVVLIQEKLRDRLPERFIEVMALDSEWSIVSAGVVDDCAATGMGLTSDHLAYVIYTSGSTGRPKGASIDHRGLANLVHWYGQEFCFSAEDRVLIVSSFSFDLTQKNFFACLLGGGVVQLAAEPFNPQRIAKAICEHCVTLLNMAPSAFYSLVNETASSDLSSVRHVFLGGEPIQLSQLSSLGRNCPQLQVVNSYGPTECTDVSSFHRLRANYAEEPAGITPIGRPIGNAQLYLLDSELNPVPMGVKGELYIGGVGVSRGYLNRPGFTAERFIPHPFDAQGGKRLYRTGDACRYLSDGNIEFIGRIDSQVKIRGFRIELGEIESRINEHPQVEQSVVIAKEDEQSNKRLIAYYTEKQPEGEGAARLTSMELRAYVQHRLPEYMVPSAYVYLNALPLTVNGKVDRKGLPVPVGESRPEQYTAPRNEVEALMCAIWAESLRVERVGVHDNFFEMGGNSLIAMRMMTRIEDELEVEISTRAIFRASTVAGLVKQLIDDSE